MMATSTDRIPASPWSQSSPGRRVALVAAALVAAALAGACKESLDGGATCIASTALCPGQGVELRDTIINPTLEYDSTYVGFPSIGGEFMLPLITRGDTLQTFAVVRFDTLVRTYLPTGDTLQTISYVDSVRLRLQVDLTRSQVPDSVRFDLYDVNGAGEDTASALTVAQFVPAKRIGGRTVAKANLVDSVFITINDSALLARLADTVSAVARLRVGIKVSATGPVSFRVGSTESARPARLYYRPRKDTSARALVISPTSGTPVDRADVSRDLLDYTVVAKRALPDYPATLSLGGIPGRRVYLRFSIPRRITDSTTIVRATLRLTQRPFPFGSATDTVVIYPHIVLASPLVTDNRRASSLIGIPGLVVTDSLSVIPRDSGVRSIELYQLVRAWGAQATATNAPARALVLTASNEGTLPRQVVFFSTTAGAAVRPTMRITYIPKIGFGVP